MTRIVCTRDAMNRKMLNTFKTQALTRTYANIELNGMRAIKCEFSSYKFHSDTGFLSNNMHNSGQKTRKNFFAHK